MKALFKEMPVFAKFRADYLSDEAFRGLQNALLEHPQAGDVIEGAGGLRKLRHVEQQERKALKEMLKHELEARQ